MTKSATTLEDKYTQLDGRVFMSANQALVRLPIDQVRRDRAAGLKTAGYISGYRGSPLGVYDAALWGAQKLLDEHDIHFVAGLNEELAATAIRGTQELAWFGESKYQGVFGLWYGKGVGVDRAMEAIKLGNHEGSSATGGYLVVAGDDPGGKSSASAHQSEHTLIAAMVPTLYPATISEILEYGIFGWAMSRYSGAYVGLKCITDTLDLSSSVELPDFNRQFAIPTDYKIPAGGLNLKPKLSPLVQEENLVAKRLPAAEAFVRANGIDRTVIDSPRRTLGIVAAGRAYLDARQALSDLGLSDEKCRDLGVRLYKPGMVWPLEREGLIRFAEGSRALLVVEEKRPVIEDQIARHLYAMPADLRPALMGKQDLNGAPLLPQIGELNAALVRKAIHAALSQLGVLDSDEARLFEEFGAIEADAGLIRGAKFRTPFYCSGCPHNTSTKIPDGSIAIAAVGCQGLAAYVMPERRTMEPVGMGADGMPWVAVSEFVEMPHVFQNMGDGTYSHSGILAIRAAVASKTNITYKLLYNDAVAMTGGQPVEGHIGPIDMLNQLVAEQVSPVILVSDQPEKFDPAKMPAGVTIHHRDELDKLQRELREKPGVSAIVYEQTCATEKRRRRKRGTFPDPDKRVFINQDVCEGCGDCSVQSNCVSIQPLETEFGRKRTIDQSTCNKDFSCIKGFCPSFVTVTGAAIAKKEIKANNLDALIEALPEPAVMAMYERGYNLLVAGIGGTGVLTVGALLGMAAHLEGKGVSVLDLTGMAQKGGGVTSHIRVGPKLDGIYTSRLGIGMTDLILACDMVVSTGADVMKTVRPGITKAIINSDVTPTGEFQTNRKMDLGGDELANVVERALQGGDVLALHASKLATDLTGDSIATNVLMLGYALQKGLLPVSRASIEEAIRLNGTFVKGNLRTLALGRLAAHAPDALARELATKTEDLHLDTLEGILQSRTRLLTEYQDEKYAERYRSFVQHVDETVKARGLEGGDLLVREVALTLAKLMAYKDEYEIGRLQTDPKFMERLKTQFSGDFKVKFHLGSPLLFAGKDNQGRPRKRAFNAAFALPIFRILAKMKGLRGTAFDLFGYQDERRMERQLIEDYRALVETILGKLNSSNLSTAIELAGSANDVRGYGPVKHKSFEEYQALTTKLLEEFVAPPKAAAEQAVGEAVPAE